MKLSDEAAKRYIQGEQFDPIEYERQHLIQLKKSAEKALADIKPVFRRNLANTVSHWIELRKNTPHREELNALVGVLNQIKESEHIH